ncbi:uncharacterized protein LOC141623235 isoform X2 [Silene latifolia]|uniref:uncharacterized protein LOC141623235 isoform X2 n=1 Tax=Silene latifolia TaxID=37657 RepID=UPI003D76AB53
MNLKRRLAKRVRPRQILTAALAQKNSEATRALALQEDMLEREIAEVQKVLLAMQDQQEKQLELILAIAKSGERYLKTSEPSIEEPV